MLHSPSRREILKLHKRTKYLKEDYWTDVLVFMLVFGVYYPECNDDYFFFSLFFLAL